MFGDKVGWGRAFAAIVALTALVGLSLQLQATLGRSGSLGEAIWVLLRYFTIITNLVVLAAFARRALTNALPRKPWLMAGVVITIGLVGVVYGVLLSGVFSVRGGEAVATVLMHDATPLLAAAWWLAFAPKGWLRYRDTALWCAPPLAYLAYAIARGAADGHYAYPFIDVAKRGAGPVAVTCALIAVGFLLSACAFVALDGWLGVGNSAEGCAQTLQHLSSKEYYRK